MHNALRILITNNALANPAGSEIYVRDLAMALVRRGHFPMAYSPILGDVAGALRRATIPVVGKLEELNAVPDLIHGHHHLEAMSAMLHFHGTPAIFVCHGWAPWEESPPVFPAIRRYVAVDDLCRERLYSTPGVRSEQVEVLYNFIDLERFKRRAELPKQARTALVFSNYASEGKRLETIRRACARVGIPKVDVAGFGSGRVVAKPENFLRRYDLVFAKARCALEALAIGATVIVADF
ncbi:MAG: glycosyltransferase, partial [Desulfobacterales bacterium]|nr:glycosyltransferase [Desulfobacterales bacterium]